MKPLKILVVSDSHGNTVALQRIIDRESPFDYLVHCGDGVSDLIHVRIPAGAKTAGVSGNIDRARHLGVEVREDLSLGKFRTLVTHGDLQYAHSDYLGLIDEAKAGGYDLVLFGHTHRQYSGKGPPAIFNPGPALNGQYGVILAGETLAFYHRKWEA